MKYGIFSDVHANLEALEKVLEYFKQEKVEGYIFLGDIVGYGADPKVCLEILRNLIAHSGCVSVAGNHDWAVSGQTSIDYFNQYARDSVEWTQKQLNDADIEFMKNMELVQRVDGFTPLETANGEAESKKKSLTGFTMVHASLNSPKDWGYIFDIDDAYLSFNLLEDNVCFIGHSHRPIVFTLATVRPSLNHNEVGGTGGVGVRARGSTSGKMVDWSLDDKIKIQKDTKYIINTGSVGQPRDGNPQSSFAIYDTDAGFVEINRIEYDISKAQQKIIDAGLPQILADRLSLGK